MITRQIAHALCICILLPTSSSYAMEERPSSTDRERFTRRLIRLLQSQSDQPWHVSFFIDRGADPAGIDQEGNSCLHLAAQNASTGSVEKLLCKGGVDVDTLNTLQLTPLAVAMLHAAETTHKAATVEALVCHGADSNRLIATHGETPLTLAVQHSRSPVVHALLQSAETKPFLRNPSGKSPCDLIAERVEALEVRRSTLRTTDPLDKDAELIIQEELRDTTKILDLLTEASKNYQPGKHRRKPSLFGRSCHSLNTHSSSPRPLLTVPDDLSHSSAVRWTTSPALSPRSGR